jgi:hypothetical protein
MQRSLPALKQRTRQLGALAGTPVKINKLHYARSTVLMSKTLPFLMQYRLKTLQREGTKVRIPLD